MQKGEIWTLNLDPTLSEEVRKTRPVVIISADLIGVLPLRVVVPFRDWNDRYSVASWIVAIDPDPLNGMQKKAAADALQLRSVSTERFVEKIGVINETTLQEIIEALQIVIGSA